MWKVHGKLRVRVLFNDRCVDEEVFDRKKITIGRDPACDLVIDNQLVSGRHARVTRAGAGYILEDLGSTNGTLLGGRAIQREVLRIGSVATVGKHKLEFIEEGESSNAEDWAQSTIAPRTAATIAASPDEAQTLYAQGALQAFLEAGGKLAELRLTKGKGTPTTLGLRKEVSMVGKDPGSDLRLSGMLMPATAFFVERTKKGYQISSVARKVLVNGAPVAGKATLQDGDEIAVGPATLRFKLVG